VIVGGFAGHVADAPALGWRFAFNVTGIVGILYAPALLFLLRDAPNQNGPAATPSNGKIGLAVEKTAKQLFSLLQLLLNPSFILLVLYFTLPALAGWIVRDWMPAILKHSFNISQGVAGVSATFYVQVASIFSAIAAGWMADRWMRRTPRGRIYVSAIGTSLLIPALFGVGNSPQLNSFGLAIVSLIMFGIGWGFFDTNSMPILSQIAPADLRATGYGLMNMISISCGGFADWGFGHLQDRHVPLNAIFGVFASLCIISVVMVLLIRPRSDLESSAQFESS
jgi:sugar phosphate permease